MPWNPTYLKLNRSLIQMLTRTTRPPPPMPCIARAAISIPILTDSAAMSEPTKKVKFAISKIGLRPQISDILPHIGVDAELPSRYAEPIQVYPAAEWKCSEMVGTAVVMMVYVAMVSPWYANRMSQRTTSIAARNTAICILLVFILSWRPVDDIHPTQT